MVLMIGPGFVSLISGLMLLWVPKRLLSRRSPRGRFWIATDPFFQTHHISAGICLISVGLFCLSSAYYVWLRLHS